MRRLLYWVRWWKWYLGGPDRGWLYLSGLDETSRRIILNRHWDQEPKP
jgi:hypothetical protein